MGHPAPLFLQWLPALPGWLLHRVRTPLYVPPWSSQFPYVQKWVLKLPGLLFILSSIPPECLGSFPAGPHLPLWLGLFPLSPGVSWLAPVKYTSTQLVYLDEIIYLTPASFRMLLLGPVGSLACCTPTPLVCAFLLLVFPAPWFSSLANLAGCCSLSWLSPWLSSPQLTPWISLLSHALVWPLLPQSLLQHSSTP